MAPTLDVLVLFFLYFATEWILKNPKASRGAPTYAVPNLLQLQDLSDGAKNLLVRRIKPTLKNGHRLKMKNKLLLSIVLRSERFFFNIS